MTSVRGKTIKQTSGRLCKHTTLHPPRLSQKALRARSPQTNARRYKEGEELAHNLQSPSPNHKNNACSNTPRPTSIEQQCRPNTDLVLHVKGVQLPERLQRASSSHANPRRATGVAVNKFRDVVHASRVGDPHAARLLRLVLGYLSLRYDRKPVTLPVGRRPCALARRSLGVRRDRGGDACCRQKSCPRQRPSRGRGVLVVQRSGRMRYRGVVTPRRQVGAERRCEGPWGESNTNTMGFILVQAWKFSATTPVQLIDQQQINILYRV